MKFFKPTHSSRPINDVHATHAVITAHEELGYGIFGFYTEFEAHATVRELAKNGYASRLELHDYESIQPGVHPAVRFRSLTY